MVTEKELETGEKTGEAAFAVYYKADGKTIVRVEDLRAVRSIKFAEAPGGTPVERSLTACPPNTVPLNIGGVICCIPR